SSATQASCWCEISCSSRCWLCSSGRGGLREQVECITFSESTSTRGGAEMARTPLANAVEEAVSKIADEEARTTRRRLLAGVGSALARASLLGFFAPSCV